MKPITNKNVNKRIKPGKKAPKNSVPMPRPIRRR